MFRYLPLFDIKPSWPKCECPPAPSPTCSKSSYIVSYTNQTIQVNIPHLTAYPAWKARNNYI